MKMTADQYQTLYASAILAFERQQAEKGLRGVLPCDYVKSVAAPKVQKQQRRHRQYKFEVIMPAIKHGEVVDTSEMCRRVKMQSKHVSSCLHQLFLVGALDRRRRSKRGRVIVWEYWRTDSPPE